MAWGVGRGPWGVFLILYFVPTLTRTCTLAHAITLVRPLGHATIDALERVLNHSDMRSELHIITFELSYLLVPSTNTHPTLPHPPRSPPAHFESIEPGMRPRMKAEGQPTSQPTAFDINDPLLSSQVIQYLLSTVT